MHANNILMSMYITSILIAFVIIVLIILYVVYQLPIRANNLLTVYVTQFFLQFFQAQPNVISEKADYAACQSKTRTFAYFV